LFLPMAPPKGVFTEISVKLGLVPHPPTGGGTTPPGGRPPPKISGKGGPGNTTRGGPPGGRALFRVKKQTNHTTKGTSFILKIHLGPVQKKRGLGSLGAPM